MSTIGKQSAIGKKEPRQESQTEADSPRMQAERWPDPIPIGREQTDLPRMTEDMLSPSLRPWLWDIAERLQVPLEYPAVSAICSLGSVIGRKVVICPKRFDDWSETANLWGVIVGPPSVLKTPAMRAALLPIHRLEDAAAAKHKAACDATGADESDGADRVPPQRRYITRDATIEALGILFQANPNGLLLARDELMGWLRTMERDGHEGDRAFYLEAWTGNGRHSTDRVTRKLTAHSMCLSLLGGIQPGPLAKFIREATTESSGNDGLMQRLQLAVWPHPPSEYRLVDRPPDKESEARAIAVFQRVDDLEPQKIGAIHDEQSGWFLRFGSDAQDDYLQSLEALERRLRAEGEHPAVIAHLGKYRGLVPKLALVFHVAECAANGSGGPVTRDALRLALRWASYLEAHARRIYGQVIEPGHQESHALADRIRSGSLCDPVTAREVTRKRWRDLSSTHAVQVALEKLVELHWLRPERTETGGRPSIRYRINPTVCRAGTDKTAKTTARAVSETEVTP